MISCECYTMQDHNAFTDEKCRCLCHTNDVWKKFKEKKYNGYDKQETEMKECDCKKEIQDLKDSIYQIIQMVTDNKRIHETEIGDLESDMQQLKDNYCKKEIESISLYIHRHDDRLRELETSANVDERIYNDLVVRIMKLEEHHVRQVDENRKASRRDNALDQDLGIAIDRIDNLELSGFKDMKNELIAFKIERNELRKTIEALESEMKTLNKYISDCDMQRFNSDQLLGERIDAIGKPLDKNNTGFKPSDLHKIVCEITIK